MRDRKKKVEAMVEHDLDAAMALIHRHLDEYEWILERTWHEQTVRKLKEEIDSLIALNPERLDVVELTRRFDEQAELVNSVRSALGQFRDTTENIAFFGLEDA